MILFIICWLLGVVAFVASFRKALDSGTGWLIITLVLMGALCLTAPMFEIFT